MKTPPRPAFLIGAALLCVSCARPAIAPSDSLVTRDPLPSSKQLSRESILIVRDIGETLRTLRYTLGPDDVLEIELVTRDNPNVSYRIETIPISETLHLPPATARQAREALWRLRPSKLLGIDQDARPLGCTRQTDHDWGEAQIAFIYQPKDKPEDADIGQVTIPTARSCDNEAAKESRKLLRQVLASFPQSRAAAEFERLEKEQL